MLKDMIRYLIDVAGMTQNEIKAATGVPQPCISRVYHGVQKDIGYRAGKAVEAVYLDVLKNR